ncbi:cytochrome c [Marimonas sp. MJW-29]|uniref:Cytochrome c n=1 Tax=Sulfitobacter sediminis TaxID=3234186 RepID=A0ABV3RRZ0_9RHOB
MKKSAISVLAPALSLVLGTGSAAQEASVEMGRMIADEYCSRCHNIEPNGPFKLQTPSFAAIAKFRSKEQIRNRIVMPLHDRMPQYLDYMIGGNIDDMVAYIVSLEN